MKLLERPRQMSDTFSGEKKEQNQGWFIKTNWTCYKSLAVILVYYSKF